MKENIDISEFDNIFKQQLENASATPPAGVWEGISSSIGSTATTTIAVKTAVWLKIGIAAIAATAIATVVYIASAPSESPDITLQENTKSNVVETTPLLTNDKDNKQELLTPPAEKVDLTPKKKPVLKTETIIDYDPAPPVSDKRNPEPPKKDNHQSGLLIDPAILKEAEKPVAEKITLNPVEKKDSAPQVFEPKNESFSRKTDSSFIFIPDVVTPNGDGLNDEYLIDIKGEESVRIIIRDNKNFKVFETTNKATAWNCIMPNGDLFPDGDYYVTVMYKFPNTSIKTKIVTLKLIR